MKFDAANWTTINKLLDSGLELPLDKRAAWLDTLAPEHHALKPDLKRLLDHAAAVETGGFLDALPPIQIDFDTRSKTGQEFGAYRLIRELGSGGMGSVWLAERTDGLIDREVALKLPHKFLSAGFDERLARERQILASLNHPNIAQLYDAGVSENGQPYLALEFVDGVPINEFCEQQQLTIKSRIRLFLDVLKAVAYAHGRLLIHRDLKPANVLVTNQGEVRLLDFGVAKLLDEGIANETELTRASGRALTLAYASPEQITGDSLTVASDIYSLGVLLFELLTVTRPYLVKRDSPAALEEAILTAEPNRPSDAVTSMSDKRGLQGDLDTIILKALSKEPDRRYETAHAFGDDLERYLSGYPVLAQADSAWYRAQRFVRRHRGGVLTATLTLILLVAAAAITTWQSVEARRQRDMAIRGQERALASNNLLNTMMGELGPRGDKMSLQELVDRGVEIVEQRYGINERSTAMTYYDLSIMYAKLGQVDTQTDLLDRVESIGRNIGDDGLIANALCAKSRQKLERDAAGSAADLEAGLAVRDRMPRRRSSRIIECFRAEGFALSAAGDHDRAIAVYRNAIDVIDEADVSSVALRMNLLNDLAEQYYKTDRPAAALDILEELVAGSEKLGRGRTVTHVIYLANRGAILGRLGEVLRASSVQLEALERVQGMDRAPVGIAQHYASSLSRLARYDEALGLYEEDYQAAETSGNKRWQGQIAMGMARALIPLHRLDDAEEKLDVAAGIFQESPDAYRREVITTRLLESRLLLARHDVDGARLQVGEILTDFSYPDDTSMPGLSGALWVAAHIAFAAGDAEAALVYASDALKLGTSIARDPELSADVGQALHQRAIAKHTLGDDVGAIEDLRRSIVSLSNGFGDEHPETLDAQRLLAQLTD